MGTENRTKEVKCYDENFNLLDTFCGLFNITLEPKRIEMPFPIKIIKQGPATIVFWRDGTKTVVKRAEGEPDDDYAAFTAAVAKKVYGSNSKIRQYLNKTTVIRK